MKMIRHIIIYTKIIDNIITIFIMCNKKVYYIYAKLPLFPSLGAGKPVLTANI